MIEAAFTQENLEYFLLILVRFASFIYIAPFFGNSNTPVRMKLGLAIFLSIILYSVLPRETLEYSSAAEYAILIIKESLAGLLIGFSAFICNTIINLTGKIIDLEIGMSMAQIFDPITNQQVSITGNLYSYFLLMIMIATDMHLFILKALVDSFQVINLGGAIMGESLYDTVVGFISTFMIIGFRISLPIFVSSLILNCVLGILAKVAPQMNMFAVGIQLKILFGLLILFLTIVLLPSIANFIFENMKIMVVSVIGGLR